MYVRLAADSSYQHALATYTAAVESGADTPSVDALHARVASARKFVMRALLKEELTYGDYSPATPEPVGQAALKQEYALISRLINTLPGNTDRGGGTEERLSALRQRQRQLRRLLGEQGAG